MENTKNNSFLNLLTSDYYKVSKLKSIYISLAVMFLLLAINFASIIIFKGKDIDITYTGKDYIFTTLSSANIGLFIAIISGIFIGKEFSDGIMRINVARGTKRAQIYISKFTVLFTLVIAYAIIMMIIGGIFTAIAGYGEEFNGWQFALLLRMIGLEVLALMSSTSIFTMFAFLLRSSGSTIGAAIGFYLIITILASVLGVIATGYAGSNPDKASSIMNAINFLPYQQSSLASSYDTLSTTNIVAAILMPIVYTVISFLIGIFSFIKRDIK